MRCYKTSKLKRSLRRCHSWSTDRAEGGKMDPQFVSYPVRGLPWQCQGPCSLGIPHAWARLFRYIFTEPAFSVSGETTTCLPPEGQAGVRAKGPGQVSSDANDTVSRVSSLCLWLRLHDRVDSFAQSSLWSSLPKDSSVSCKQIRFWLAEALLDSCWNISEPRIWAQLRLSLTLWGLKLKPRIQDKSYGLTLVQEWYGWKLNVTKLLRR